MVASEVPTSISAVESNGISIVFYARANGELASLTAQSKGEDPNHPPYRPANIIFDGNTVVSAVPQVSAVAYQFNDSNQIRLYYIKGTSQNLHLAELVKYDDGDWREGALDKNLVSITKDSLISANVEAGSGQVKVF